MLIAADNAGVLAALLVGDASWIADAGKPEEPLVGEVGLLVDPPPHAASVRQQAKDAILFGLYEFMQAALLQVDE
jgi:hypothetical protein